ncbi:MAG: hypothetical protein ACI89X_002455 [Planctomycetota bacterium]|jgi:hypothetical protein
MSPRSLLFAAFTLLLAAVSTAQDTCPKKQAKHVPEKVVSHGELPCSGGTISFGGLTLISQSTACPMFATHTMEHEIEEDSRDKTMIEVTGQSSSWIYFFECQRDWLLIIPWGSNCTMSSTTIGPDLVRYRTIPCKPEPPIPPVK